MPATRTLTYRPGPGLRGTNFSRATLVLSEIRNVNR